MNTFILTLYILVWPVLAAGVLAALSLGIWKDIRQARRSGDHLV